MRLSSRLNIAVLSTSPNSKYSGSKLLASDRVDGIGIGIEELWEKKKASPSIPSTGADEPI